MEGSLSPAETAGRRAREAIDAELAAGDDLGAVRARLEGRVRSVRRSRRGAAVVATLAAAAALIVAILAWPRPLTLTVEGAPAAAGTFVAAGEAPATIRFGDGTEIVVEPKGRARVASVASKGATVVLERGVARAHVVHRPNATWHVFAGPFDVHVVGTRFDVSWDPERETFRLALHEGAVVVSGGLLEKGRSVSAGQTLVVSLREGRTELAPASTIVEPTSSTASMEAPLAKTPAEPTAHPSAPLPPPPRPWQPLAAAGKYAAALEQAKQLGFAHECEVASARDVLLLGDVARLAGDPTRANEAYRAVRRRFPKTSAAATAAFALGRIAFDRTHAYAEAASWFETSLKEGGGPFAREAAGRLIEARKAAGDLAGAKSAAKAYLDKYPEGPHAALAKGLVAE